MAIGCWHGKVICTSDVVDVSDWLAASGDGRSRLLGRHGFDRRVTTIEHLEHVVDLVVENRIALQPHHLTAHEKLYCCYYSYHYVYKTSAGGVLLAVMAAHFRGCAANFSRQVVCNVLSGIFVCGKFASQSDGRKPVYREPARKPNLE
jgi:hypothetical protein